MAIETRTTSVAAARWRRFAAWLAADWRGGRFVAAGAVVVLVTCAVTAMYYANRPLVQTDPDTAAYVAGAGNIARSLRFVDAARLPGYPLLIALVFAVAGDGNLGAVSIVQAVLFVLAVAELYALLALVLRHALPAAVGALLVGTNTHILSYVKPVLSEALALFLVVTLALAVTLALRSWRPAALWGVAVILAALCLTRPEWIYLPVPLVAYLLFVAWRRGHLRKLLPHALAALLMVYAVLGLYIARNAAQNGCACLTDIQNFNLLGKVMQYDMQGEAPPQYDEFARLVESYVARGDLDPWDVVRSNYPPLLRDHAALAGEFSVAIIVRHPLEYLGKSVPVARHVLVSETPSAPVAADGPFGGALLALDAVSRWVIRGMLYFPLAALLWWVLAGWRAGRAHAAEALGALALLGFYGLALTALGAYVYYARLHTPYAALLLATLWSTVVLAVMRGAPIARRWLTDGARAGVRRR